MAKKFTLTDQSMNDRKFVVLTAGIKLTRFKKNPVMLNNHNPTELLGKWVNLEVNGEVITAEPKFNTKNALAASKAQEVEDEFLNGASLGLNPIRFANGSEFGFGEDVLVLAESELIEASIVSIPSNENSIQLYGNDGQPLAEEELNKIRLSHGGKGSPEKSNQNRNMDFKHLAIAELGLKAEATDTEVAAAMQTAFNNAKSLADENAKLKLAAETAEANQLETMLDAAVEAGKIPVAAKAGYIALGKGNIATIKTILDAITPAATAPVNLAAQLGGAAANAAAGNPNDKANWKLKDYLEKDYYGLIALKAKDYAAYTKLYTEAGVEVQA